MRKQRFLFFLNQPAGLLKIAQVGLSEQGALVHLGDSNAHGGKSGSPKTAREESLYAAGINSCSDRTRAVVKVGIQVPSAPLISSLLFGNMIELMGRQLRGGLLAQLLVDRKFYHSAGTAASPWKLVRSGISRIARTSFLFLSLSLFSDQLSVRLSLFYPCVIMTLIDCPCSRGGKQ